MPLPVVRQGGFRESDAPADQILTRAARHRPRAPGHLHGSARTPPARCPASGRSSLGRQHALHPRSRSPGRLSPGGPHARGESLRAQRPPHCPGPLQAALLQRAPRGDLQAHLARRGGHLRADEAHADYHGTRTRLGDLTDRIALSMVRCLPCAKRILLSHEKQGVEPYRGFS